MTVEMEVGQWWSVQASQGCEVEGQMVKLAAGQSAKLGPDEPMSFEVVTVHSEENQTVVKVHPGIAFPITSSGFVEQTLEPGNKVFTLTGDATLGLGKTDHFDPLTIKNIPVLKGGT